MTTNPTLRPLAPLALMALAALSPVANAATATEATPSAWATGAPRWDAAFAAFAEDDVAHPRPAGGVLFIGSSSIRLWRDLETQFRELPVVIKRGFGGSQLADCVKNLNRLVVRYRPRMVLVYEGDNDLAAGVAPLEVLRRFAAFVDGVHRDLPQTRIAYISIKPSPARAALLPRIRETNALIRDYVALGENTDYIDVFSAMLDAEGAPRAELFRADRLHLNADGYALWKTLIAPHVR